jgi:hypothetical protein
VSENASGSVSGNVSENVSENATSEGKPEGKAELRAMVASKRYNDRWFAVGHTLSLLLCLCAVNAPRYRNVCISSIQHCMGASEGLVNARQSTNKVSQRRFVV